MVCPQCGTQGESKDLFCRSCGAPLSAQAAPAAPEPPGALPSDPAPAAGGAALKDRYRGKKMKWYKFLCYFGLWVVMLLNVVNGLSNMAATSGGDTGLYDYFPQLRIPGMVMGAFISLLGIGYGLAAIRLINLRRGAPRLLLILYAVSLLANVFFVVWTASLSVGLEHIGALITGSDLISLVGSVLMIIINAIYFRKRAELFVN